MDKSTRDVRLAHWASLIQQCNESGLSKKAWCAQNQINEKSFYYWQRCVRKALFHKQTSTTIAMSFVEVSAISETAVAHAPIAATIRIMAARMESLIQHPANFFSIS